MQGWHCPKRWTIARKPSPSPYLPRKASSCVRKLFDWSSQGSNSHHLRDEGGRSGWSPFSHNTNHPFPEGKKRLILFRPYPDVHLLVKLCCHLCERETLSKKIKIKKQNKTKKKKKKGRKRREQQRKWTLILLLNCYSTQNEGGRLETKTMMSQGSWVDQVAKIINRLRILYSCLYATPVPAFELWTFLNYTDAANKRLVTNQGKRRRRKNLQKDTPRLGALQRWNNLGTSPQNLSERVFHPSPDMKKNWDFQYRKDEGRSVMILAFLTQGTSS